jgi:transposase
MPKAISNDLRCRILQAYEREAVSLRELANRFAVSFDYVRKIRKQQLRSGQMERVPQRRHGVERRVSEQLASQIRQQVEQQPDLTLEQLRSWVWQQAQVSLSRSLVWLTLRRLGLRLKKSPSMRSSATRKKTAGGVKSSSRVSSRSPRND